MHIRSGQFNIPQRRDFEETLLLGLARDATDTEVHIREFEPIVEYIGGDKIICSMTGGAGCCSDLAQKDLPAKVLLRGEIGEAHRGSLVKFRVRGNDGTHELRQCERDALGSHYRRVINRVK